jgi:hypothetical protein
MWVLLMSVLVMVSSATPEEETVPSGEELRRQVLEDFRRTPLGRSAQQSELRGDDSSACHRDIERYCQPHCDQPAGGPSDALSDCAAVAGHDPRVPSVHSAPVAACLEEHLPLLGSQCRDYHLGRQECLTAAVVKNHCPSPLRFPQMAYGCIRRVLSQVQSEDQAAEAYGRRCSRSPYARSLIGTGGGSAMNGIIAMALERHGISASGLEQPAISEQPPPTSESQGSRSLGGRAAVDGEDTARRTPEPSARAEERQLPLPEGPPPWFAELNIRVLREGDDIP